MNNTKKKHIVWHTFRQAKNKCLKLGKLCQGVDVMYDLLNGKLKKYGSKYLSWKK